jgi:hypothetical protein
MDTPSQRIAAQIVERLLREGLVSADAARELALKLAEGTLRAEDWQAGLAPAQPKEDRR